MRAVGAERPQQYGECGNACKCAKSVGAERTRDEQQRASLYQEPASKHNAGSQRAGRYGASQQTLHLICGLSAPRHCFTLR